MKMPQLPKQFVDAVVRLHHDDRGAEGLEKLLILAAIVLPLLGLLILFRGRISDFVNGEWDKVTDKNAQPIDSPGNP